jgi:hypothetical protein
MEAASVKALIPVEATIPVPVAFATEPLMIAPPVAVAPSVMIAVPASSIETVPTAVVTAPIEAAEPRTRTDEHPTRKIIRAVVTVRGASIWCVAVVTVRAVRRRAHVNRAWRGDNCSNSDAESHAHLCLGRSQPRDKYEEP